MNRISLLLAIAIISIATTDSLAAEKLSDVLREAKWDGIVGTWVDSDTKGAGFKVTYAWKIRDRVLEATSVERNGQKTSVGLMGVNGKSDEVFDVGADSDGTSWLGAWKIDENGDAVLGIAYTTEDGQEGVLSIRYHSEDKDTITMTIELPQPIKVKLVRAKVQE